VGTASKRKLGEEAEKLACDYLKKKGWFIIETNYFAGRFEIDIIARKGSLIAFIEVKMRSTDRFGRPADQVSEHKVRRIFAAADLWLQRSGFYGSVVRFDVIGILKQPNGNVQVEHLEDAYR